MTPIRRYRLAFVVLLVGLEAGCVLSDPAAFLKEPAPPPTAVMVESSADVIILQWDPPVSEIARYLVSYRVHKGTHWVLLGTAPAAPLPEFTIPHADLGNGDFDFSIAAENPAGERSDLHMSLDPTAQPPTGWFLRWIR